MKKQILCCLFIGQLCWGCADKSTLYSEFVGDAENQVEVIVVTGTPDEMGYALGKHLQDKATITLENYLSAAFNVDSNLMSPPNLLQAWQAAEPFLDKRFLEEMKGFSRGSGIELERLEEAHAIPIVAPYSCSGGDFWGKASLNGDLYQIRNLDYSIDWGLQQFPVVVVYRPDKGIAHANISFAGVLSCHTGINEQSIVLGEKGESPAGELPYDLHGNHFSVLFRQILYDAKNLEEAERLIESATWTKRYYLFVGDGKKKEHAAVKYLISAPDSVKFYKWTDMDTVDVRVPKIFPDVTYYTVKNDAAREYIDENYGKIGESEMIRLSRLVAAKDNLVDVVYNASSQNIWVAYATAKKRAAECNYVHVDLKKYFKH